MKTLDIKIDGNYETGESITTLCAMYLEIDKDKAIHIFESNKSPIEHFVHYVSIVITHPYVMLSSRTENMSNFINIFKAKLLEDGYCEENEHGTLFASDVEDSARIRIGQRVCDLRKEKGMSQKELAEAIGTHQGHIARLEAGKHNVRIDILQSIADVFDMKIDFVNAK